MSKGYEFSKKFSSESEAIKFCTSKNRHTVDSKFYVCVVEGPESDWFVMDIKSAYDIETTHTTYF